MLVTNNQEVLQSLFLLPFSFSDDLSSGIVDITILQWGFDYLTVVKVHKFPLDKIHFNILSSMYTHSEEWIQGFTTQIFIYVSNSTLKNNH